jgi:hypothetical protein
MNEILSKVMILVVWLLLITVFSFLLSWPVMILWNHCLISAVDGVHTITWVQAWGINVLFSTLFKPTNVSSKK